MKFLKYSLIAALAFSGVLTACSDDDSDYKPAPQSPGAYFVGAATQSITLGEQDTQFSINVARTDETALADYTLVASTSAEAGVFTIPASVHFDADQMETVITIGVDPVALGAGNEETIKLAFGEDVPVTAYGNSSVTLQVEIPEPYKYLGKGLYCETILNGLFNFNSDDLYDGMIYEVDVEESEKVPGVYRINAYGEGTPWWDEDEEVGPYYITVNASDPDHVFFEPQSTGIDMGNYGEIYLASNIPTYFENGTEQNYGKLQDLVITFPTANSILGSLIDDGERGWYYCNKNGNAMIVLPGGVYGDYSCDIEYSGLFHNASDDTYAGVVSVTLGEDVQEARVAMVLAGSADEAVQMVKNGEVETVSIKYMEEPQTVFAPVDGDGTYFATVVTYANGTAQKSATATARITIASGGDDNADWEDFGNALIIDGWCTARYKFGSDGQYTYEDFPWEFPVQRNKQNPDIYRFCNIWTSDPDYNVLLVNGINANTADSYVIVDCSNPNAVIIEPQWGGFTWPKTDTTFKGADMIIGNTVGMYIASGYDLDSILAYLETSEDEVADPISDGLIYIQDALFAVNGQFGYSWQSNPYSAFLIENLAPEEGAAAPAKVGRRTVMNIHTIMNKPATPARKQSKTMLRPFLQKVNEHVNF